MLIYLVLSLIKFFQVGTNILVMTAVQVFLTIKITVILEPSIQFSSVLIFWKTAYK